MRSATPKVLHPLCGRPMLAYVLDAWASTADGRRVGRRSSSTRHRSRPSCRAFAGRGDVRPPGRAARDRATPSAPPWPRSPTTRPRSSCSVGDVPLVTGADLDAVLEARRADDAAIALASVYAADPDQLGRVVRSEFGTVERIVEAKDATPGGARRQRDQRRPVRVRCRLAAPADRLARAVGRDRRALPDRPRPARPRGRPDRQRGRLRGRRAVRRHQRPRPARRGRVEPARPPQRGAHAQRRDDARPVDGLPRLVGRARRRRHARAERDPARRDPGRRRQRHRAGQPARRFDGRRSGPGSGRASSNRRRSRTTRRSGRTATSDPAASSGGAPRSATSPSSRTRVSAPASKQHHMSYLGDAELGERVNVGAGDDHRQLRRHDASTARRSATAPSSGSTR